MNDPYKVLNIAPTATDDEVKHAYRELARKYHPDNYHDNPLADLAQEKMKEINEAYDQIQKQRKSGSATRQTGGGYGQSQSYSYGGGTNATPEMQQVRMAINRGDISLAERLLNASTDRSADWNFLMGVVALRRGWMDDAKRYFTTACRMDPSNTEYRGALERFQSASYRPEAYRGFNSMMFGEDTCTRLCVAYSCCMLSGGRCLFC